MITTTVPRLLARTIVKKIRLAIVALATPNVEPSTEVLSLTNLDATLPPVSADLAKSMLIAQLLPLTAEVTEVAMLAEEVLVELLMEVKMLTNKTATH